MIPNIVYTPEWATSSIRVLEKRIEEGGGDTIELKRTRNSLLNIYTRVPPEILGYIFVWSVCQKEDHSLFTHSHFNGLRKGSYNFPLVCHHWFKVVSSTPELWKVWGNSLQDWRERHHRGGISPADLVLSGCADGRWSQISNTLYHGLRARSTQDTIRQLHLSGAGVYVLSDIISSLTPDESDIRHSSIESIDLRVWGGQRCGYFSFLRSTRFPKIAESLPSWCLEDAVVGPPRPTDHSSDHSIAQHQRILARAASNHPPVVVDPGFKSQPSRTLNDRLCNTRR